MKGYNSSVATQKESIPVLAGRPEATRAAQTVIRMIHRKALRQGDHVPSQQELCASMGVSNNALSAAMRVLVANGVLTRKPRVGTVVVDPNQQIRGLWRVGLAILPATASMPYYGELFHRVQLHLQDAGCVTSVYLRDEQLHRPEGSKLEHFQFLLDDLHRRPLDAVLDLAGLTGENWRERAESGLILVHAGPWEDAPCGVVIEQGQMARHAVHALVDRGCRRLATVSMWGHDRGPARYWQGFVQGLQEAGMPAATAEQSLHGGEGPVGGCNVAAQLLAMPPHERPDGLVVVDDRVAMGLTASIVQSDYRPRIAVQTNRQAPLAFALPVLHFEVDIEDLARRAIDMLLRRLNRPDLPMERQWLYPGIATAAESHMSTSLTSGSALTSGA